jgi:4-hydroxybenzoyl-CoA thioesterase
MSLTHTYLLRVEFGDCDPAQIVWFPHFFRWGDAATRHFFVQCGLPSWRESERERGIFGTPMVDIQARFLHPASYGDELAIDSSITEWRRKSFVMTHRIRRGETLLVEITEVRVFARRKGDGSDPHAIEAVPVPADWRLQCSATG